MRANNEDLFSKSISDLRQMHTSNDFEQNEAVQQKRENERLVYIFKNIVQDLTELTEKIDLLQAKPPYLNNTFTLWRQQAYKRLLQSTSYSLVKSKELWRAKFIAEIDEIIFIKYVSKLGVLYERAVQYDQYQVPGSLSLKEMYERYKFGENVLILTKQIAAWCIQLELAEDLIARVQLYGQKDALKVFKQAGGAVSNELRLKLIAEQEALLKDPENLYEWKELFADKRLAITRAVTFGLSKAQKVCESKRLTTWGTGAAFAYSIVTTATVPWSLALFGLGSQFIGKGLDQLLVALQTPEKRQHISALTEVYTKMAQYLEQHIKNCESLLKECVQGINKQEELALAVETIIKDYGEQNKVEEEEVEQQSETQHFTIEHKGEVLQCTQLNDDWVQIDPEEIPDQFGDSEDQL